MSSSFRRPVQRRQQQANIPLVNREAPELGTDAASSIDTNNNSNNKSSSSSHVVFSRLRGTKPWTNGITLTSFGVRDVDSILGGGQPLGTCVLVEEDRWTLDFSLSLVRYWCAEAISQEQFLWIPILDHGGTNSNKTDEAPSSHQSLSEDFDDDQRSITGTFLSTQREKQRQAEELLRLLPRNLHWDKQSEKNTNAQQQETLHAPSKALEPLLEGDDSEGDDEDPATAGDDNDEEEDNEGLLIAWQYRKSIQQQRMGHGSISSSSTSSTSMRSASTSNYRNIFCHSYDLSGCMTDQKPCSDIQPYHCMVPLHVCEPTCSVVRRSCGFRLFQQLVRRLQQHILEHPHQVVRLLLYRLEESLCDMMSVALPLLLSTIRQHEWPVVILTTIQTWKLPTTINSSSLLSLRRTVDVAMQLDSFAARRDYPPPPEFRQFQGVLVLQKLAPTSVVSGHFGQTMLKPPAMVYGMKRDRRKLHVSLLHIPPEDFFQQGSVGGGGVRSGAGRSCASGASTTTNATTTSCGGGGGGGGGGDKASSMEF